MNSINDFSGRLVTLNDGRAGIRGGIHVEIREPSGSQPSTLDSQPVLDFISSDESLDRYNETISAAGWRLDNYQRNPVFQNAHQHGDIIHTIGRALTTEVRSGTLRQRVQFACDINPIARIAYGLYRGKFLNAVSVGFVPIRWKDGTDKDCRRRREETLTEDDTAENDPSATRADQSLLTSSPTMKGHARRIYLEQELLEVSAVAIPANPNALTLGLKSGAIEKSDLRDCYDLFRLTLDRNADCQSADHISRSERQKQGNHLVAGLGSQSPTVSRPDTELLQLALEFHRLLKS